jgi:hypothetical protein
MKEISASLACLKSMDSLTANLNKILGECFVKKANKRRVVSTRAAHLSYQR